MHPFRLALILVLLAVAGCSTGVRETPPTGDQRLQSQAQTLEATGDFQGAAAIYLRAAEQASPPLKQHYLLSAADWLIRAGDYEHAEDVLAGIAADGLPEAQRQHYDVTEARLDLARNHPKQALERLQAMPTGGTITMSGENLTINSTSILPLAPGRYVKISIRDQGIGIPDKYLPKIFDPYFTTKHQGSGLGLAVAYSIVKNHQGHIAVTSTLGEGTTFHIYLPASSRKFPQPPRESTKALSGTGKILIMDDDAMVRDVLSKMLISLG